MYQLGPLGSWQDGIRTANSIWELVLVKNKGTDTKGERQWSEYDTDLSESANSVGHSEVKITF